MTELNTLYYNSASGNCYTGSGNILKSFYFTNEGLSQEARDLSADTLYYLGGSPPIQNYMPMISIILNVEQLYGEQLRPDL